jgi:hypothetical protein
MNKSLSMPVRDPVTQSYIALLSGIFHSHRAQVQYERVLSEIHSLHTHSWHIHPTFVVHPLHIHPL